MLDHVSLGVRALPPATAFYREVLGTLGYRVHRETPDEVAFGPGEDWSFFLYAAAPDDAIVGARMHVAFLATTRERVRAFYDAAIAAGGRAVADRAPAHRPQFGEHYYGAVLKDPDGHAIEVLSRSTAAARFGYAARGRDTGAAAMDMRDFLTRVSPSGAAWQREGDSNFESARAQYEIAKAHGWVRALDEHAGSEGEAGLDFFAAGITPAGEQELSRLRQAFRRPGGPGERR